MPHIYNNGVCPGGTTVIKTNRINGYGRPLIKLWLKIYLFRVGIIIIATVFVVYFNFFSDQNNLELTTTFAMISSKNAYDLVNNSTKNLTIIDIRACKCNYETNHLPGAVWDINPKSFYNTTDDLLVYDIDGSKSIDFCKKLVNNVYGKIMFLQGGFDINLANPPYVRQELIKEIKPLLKKNFPKVYTSTADLYCYFYARSLELIKNEGMLVYISSNKGCDSYNSKNDVSMIIMSIVFNDSSAPFSTSNSKPCTSTLSKTLGRYSIWADIESRVFILIVSGFDSFV